MVLSLLHVFLLIHFSPGYHLQHLCSNNREVGVKSIPSAVCKSCPVCFYRLIRVCINSCIKIVWFKRCSYSSFLDSKNKVMIFVGIFVFVLGFGFFWEVGGCCFKKPYNDYPRKCMYLFFCGNLIFITLRPLELQFCSK